LKVNKLSRPRPPSEASKIISTGSYGTPVPQYDSKLTRSPRKRWHDLAPATRRLLATRFWRSIAQGTLVVDLALYLHALGWRGASIGLVLSAGGLSGAASPFFSHTNCLLAPALWWPSPVQSLFCSLSRSSWRDSAEGRTGPLAHSRQRSRHGWPKLSCLNKGEWYTVSIQP
jgi:hypothetical protein